MYIWVQPGGERFVNWAKKMHSKLAAQRELINLPAMQKFWLVEGHRIDIRSAQEADWIRITGGGGPGGYVIFPYLRSPEGVVVHPPLTDGINILKFISGQQPKIVFVPTPHQPNLPFDIDYISPWYTNIDRATETAATEVGGDLYGYLNGITFTRFGQQIIANVVFTHTAVDGAKHILDAALDKKIYTSPDGVALTGILPIIPGGGSKDTVEWAHAGIDTSPDGRHMILGTTDWDFVSGIFKDLPLTPDCFQVDIDLLSSPQVQSTDLTTIPLPESGYHQEAVTSGTGACNYHTVASSSTHRRPISVWYGFDAESNRVAVELHAEESSDTAQSYICSGTPATRTIDSVYGSIGTGEPNLIKLPSGKEEVFASPSHTNIHAVRPPDSGLPANSGWIVTGTSIIYDHAFFDIYYVDVSIPAVVFSRVTRKFTMVDPGTRVSDNGSSVFLLDSIVEPSNTVDYFILTENALENIYSKTVISPPEARTISLVTYGGANSSVDIPATTKIVDVFPPRQNPTHSGPVFTHNYPPAAFAAKNQGEYACAVFGAFGFGLETPYPAAPLGFSKGVKKALIKRLIEIVTPLAHPVGGPDNPTYVQILADLQTGKYPDIKFDDAGLAGPDIANTLSKYFPGYVAFVNDPFVYYAQNRANFRLAYISRI